MEATGEFYVTLVSNVDGGGNRSSSFLTRLPERLNVSNYECGLAEIIYCQSYDSITEKLGYTVFDKDGKATAFHLEAGKYSSMGELVEALSKTRTRREAPVTQQAGSVSGPVNQNGSTTQKTTPGQPAKNSKETSGTPAQTTQSPKGPHVSFSYSEISKRIFVNIDKERVERVELSEQLAYILGFRNLSLSNSAIGEYAPDLQNNTSLIFIYSDIVYPQMVANKRIQLLRVIPAANAPHGAMVKQTFDNIFFFPLLSSCVDAITVTLTNELGKEIPYNFGTTVCVLKFRPRVN